MGKFLKRSGGTKAKSLASRNGSDMANWRSTLQAARVKFDDDAKNTFLQHLAKTDQLGASAKAAGVCMQTVRDHADNDPDFAEAMMEARETYRDYIRSHVHDFAVLGKDEPIISKTKEGTEIIGHKTIYFPGILQMEAKRVDPSYRENAPSTNIQVNTGVLLAPGHMSPEDWIAEQEELNLTRERPNEDGT